MRVVGLISAVKSLNLFIIVSRTGNDQAGN